MLVNQNPINGVNFPNDGGEFRISFSRYAIWRNCPLAFKLDQIDKVGIPFQGNIYTVFGSIVGDYVEKLFAKEKDPEGIGSEFIQEFEAECLKQKDIINSHPKLKYSHKLVSEFGDHGLLILNAVRKKLKTNPWKSWEFIAYEHHLHEPIPEEFTAGVVDDRKFILDEETQRNTLINEKEGKGPYFNGFIDLLVRDEEGKILIIDFKTATRPWDMWKKRDGNLKAQLKLYKYFYHTQTGTPLEDIRTMFIVLPRTQSKRHYQEIEMPFGKRAIMNEMKKVKQFFQSVYKTKLYFPVLEDHACKWCDFKGTKHCPSSKMM